MRLLAIGVSITAVLVLSGCSEVEVRPVDGSVHIAHVCIQENPTVIVSDFIPVVQDGFSRHDISTEIISGGIPERCEFVLTYAADKTRDPVPPFFTYLSYGELRLAREGREIGYAVYDVNRSPIALDKTAGTKEKMDPVIDKLLSSNR